MSLILFSCTKPETRKAVFDSIDFTYSNGGTRLISVYLDRNKILNVRVAELNKGIRYYRTLLDDTLFYKIDSTAAAFYKGKHDTIVNYPAMDACSYDFIITVNAKQFHSRVYCNGNIDQLSDNLVYSLLGISEKIKTEIKDSTFVYKIYEHIVPLVMDTDVVFVPPVIKDDEVEK
jgi:hypothetical protein